MKALINVSLFKQLENQGHQVAYKKRNNVVIRASLVDPVMKLFEKGVITSEELAAATRYSNDHELSNLTNHSRPIYNGTPSSTSGASKDHSLSDFQLQACKNVEAIAILVSQCQSHRKRKLKKKALGLFGGFNINSYQKVLSTIFERKLSIRVAEKVTGINHSVIESKSKEIAKTILNYYKN